MPIWPAAESANLRVERETCTVPKVGRATPISSSPSLQVVSSDLDFYVVSRLEAARGRFGGSGSTRRSTTMRFPET